MDLPNKITFQSPPFAVVTIQKGQFGYKKQTNARLGRDNNGNIYFHIYNGKYKYIQDENNPNVFHLHQ